MLQKLIHNIWHWLSCFNQAGDLGDGTSGPVILAYNCIEPKGKHFFSKDAIFWETLLAYLIND